MKKYLSIIGYPLEHSISPVFQQAALDFCEMDMEYEAWETPPGKLAAAVGELRYPRNAGANITIPYKEEVLNYLDEIDSLAYDIGAANTIVKEESVLVGYNTDAPGFLRALKDDGSFDPVGKAAVVIGAGGAARAVCHALLSAGASEITVVNRSRDRADDLVDALRQKVAEKGASAGVSAVSWGVAEMVGALGSCELVVNCTSMGMKHGGQEKLSPLTQDQIPSRALVCDVVYNPAETPLLKLAAAAGAMTLGGLPMLVYQGVAAFELWTGKEAPVEVMFEAAKRALS